MRSANPRRWPAVASAVLAVVVAVLVAGCGADPDGGGRGGAGPDPLPDDTHRRVLGQGVDPALVHTIELAGYELAEKSAGVVGDSDYAATYLPADPPHATEVHLTVQHGEYDDARCGSEPLRSPTGGAPVPVDSCEPDADGWYRSGTGAHEYVVRLAGHHLRLTAPSDAVDRESLREAALEARRQDGTAPLPASPSTPPTRGDLPSTGDGAPVDPGGTGAPGG